ncbi:MAG: DUF4147 domain-containing protein [Candidatus Thiodiazotropha sp. (ex Monitilora ramsayi)]|nr:DUF4147 domain-containing protein [Candidatus Thiodiazotropha sp. (ex Monitilora ramsayi)]
MEQERLRTQYRSDLLEIYRAALARVEGTAAVSAWLERHPIEGPVQLVAVGKAAQSMATGAHQVLGSQIETALIITKTGHLDSLICRRLGWEGIEAAHPVPDERSLQAGRRLLASLEEGGDLPLLILISGGASSLLEVPVAGVDLEFLSLANQWLLGSGLDIVQMNRIRKGFSLVKGGGLLSYMHGRAIHALAISDVPGDSPAAIGSGLLVEEPDLSSQLSDLSLPEWLRRPLMRGLVERPQPLAEGPQVHIVANLSLAKEAAAVRADQLGYDVFLHETFLSGDAAEAGQRLVAELNKGGEGVSIWGGETTVRLPPLPGRGGRNQHLALSAVVSLAGVTGCYLLAAGTDGTDGPTEDAGAIVDGETLKRAQIEGFDAARSLMAADAGSFLEASGDLIFTGPTGTNVMDLVIGLRC